MDDYEEGTWSPALVGLSNTPNFHNISGKYTKIGRVVTVQFFAQTAGSPNPSFSNNASAFSVSGIPFAPDGNGYTGAQGSVNAQAFNYVGSANTQGVGGGTGGCYLTASINGSSHMNFEVTNSGGTRGKVDNGGAASGFIIEATITYFTNA